MNTYTIRSLLYLTVCHKSKAENLFIYLLIHLFNFFSEEAGGDCSNRIVGNLAVI